MFCQVPRQKICPIRWRKLSLHSVLKSSSGKNRVYYLISTDKLKTHIDIPDETSFTRSGSLWKSLEATLPATLEKKITCWYTVFFLTHSISIMYFFYLWFILTVHTLLIQTNGCSESGDLQSKPLHYPSTTALLPQCDLIKPKQILFSSCEGPRDKQNNKLYHSHTPNDKTHRQLEVYILGIGFFLFIRDIFPSVIER